MMDDWMICLAVYIEIYMAVSLYGSLLGWSWMDGLLFVEQYWPSTPSSLFFTLSFLSLTHSLLASFSALSYSAFPGRHPGELRRFHELPYAEQTSLLHKRLGDYSRKVYKKSLVTRVQERESVICMRENPFYINTVRDFRDRYALFHAHIHHMDTSSIYSCKSFVLLHVYSASYNLHS